jgi:phosphoribosylformimino-5-aminoimidazole carboxamide ribotide isomerase
VFSLDLREGRPLAGPGWAGAGPFEIASQTLEGGVRRLLVLDLARVGVGAGTGTEDLCAQLVAAGAEVSVGGGVRGPDDLRRLAGLGVAAVLVASALHDGGLTREDVEALAS